MSKTASFYETIDQIITHGVQRDILHLYNEEHTFSENYIQIRGQRVVNFGSCSYLGLEFDERLKRGAKEAIDRYGTQFSESRAYVSLKLYYELEEAFERIFEQPVVIVPTTTLGHMANLPVLVQDSDAVILDHQVHNSVQMAANSLRSRGVHTELVRHNRMDQVAERVRELRARHKKIWYMADGVYSMFGDNCPVGELYAMLDQYPELHAYVDDAHGMSIYGKHGRGWVLAEHPMHPRLVMATSLAKAFATGGAVMVYPDKEQRRKVRNCGQPLLSSGPLQPAILGAALASARIHLSTEITELQTELRERRKYAHLMLKKYGLPVVSRPDGAIFYVGVSLPRMGYNMVARMLSAGYYVNLGVFPVVPMKQAGVRFTITRLHTFAQIEGMIATMAEELPRALKEEGMRLAEIYKAFKMPLPEEASIESAVNLALRQSLSLKVSHAHSIEEVDRAEWDALMQDRGTFDREGMRTLEAAFSGNEQPENNWVFDYLFIRDQDGKAVVASFLTTGLWKDDMLYPAAVSRHVEEARKGDPYYLTTKVTALGSLLTEGEHLYIDRLSPLWKEALCLFIEQVYALQEKYRSGNVVFRDFHAIEPELDALMVDNGFVRVSMPETNILSDLGWEGKDGYYASLSPRSRQHYREDVRKHEENFLITAVTERPDPNVLDHWYALYQNVKAHSLDLNTFDLPRKWFSCIFDNPSWEVLTLTLEPGYNPGGGPVCMVISYKAGRNYVPMVIGLDYSFNPRFKVYRQALYQLVLRANTLGKQRVCLGFAASVEKKKVGARQVQAYAYMHSKDTFNMEVLAGLSVPSVKTI